MSQQTLEIHLVGGSVVRYTMRLGDECILAPMALFRPLALGLQGTSLIRSQTRAEPDGDDPHDEDYLRQTQRQSWVNIPVQGFSFGFILFMPKQEGISILML